ncbi:MAG: tetratricopeptide repeat protein [Myxococcales bacterium]|nr:MAG: tetratricopeptide repeat protein [Myxococcales bacterium]
MRPGRRGAWWRRLALGALGLGLGGCTLFQGEVTRQVHGREIAGPFVSEPAYAAYLQGALAEQAHDLDRAEGFFASACELDPGAVDPRVRLGAVRCARSTGAGDDDFRAAERLDADFGPLHRERGACQLRRGDPAAARRQLERALALDPTDPQTPLLLARAALAAGDGPGAARWVEALAARSPLSPDALAFVRDRAAEPALAPLARRLARVDSNPQPMEAPDRTAVLDRALAGSSLDEARALGRRARLTPGELAVRLVALGRRALGAEQARLVLAADPSSADARIALLVAARSPDDQRAALTGAPPSSTPPGALAALLLAAQVSQRSGREAGQAVLRLVPPGSGGDDALAAALRGRLEAP